MRKFTKICLCLILLLPITAFYMSLRNRKTEMLMQYNQKDLNCKKFNISAYDKNRKIFDLKYNVLKNKDLKYILQWTPRERIPFIYMDKGQKRFISSNCKFTNCFVTADRFLGGHYTKFDVIAFAGPDVFKMKLKYLPQKRSPHQKFVFASMESADNYPFCSKHLDGFFNWTWTYRLDSESRWGYIAVRDSSGKVIGPKKEMHWMKLEDMDPVTDEFKKSLQNKTKAAAWFVSNCRTRSRREDLVAALQKQLAKYQLKVDIYGKCGDLTCKRTNEFVCDKLIEKNYYFYLSFESSFSEDYVTEKLVHGLNYNAIPIVYGGANYTRFMPDGIYLNAREMTVPELAKKMYDLIEDKEKYAEFFKWKKYYKYNKRDSVAETNDYCGMCALLNNEEQTNKVTIYNNFKEWWTPPHRC